MIEKNVVPGIENLVFTGYQRFKNKRVGLLCHAASVTREYQHSAEVFHEIFGKNLTALFSPQHGLVGNLQDNMIETPHSLDPRFGIPIYSLYSETRKPTPEMLKDIEVLFIDLQDIGCRIYTYIYTTLLAMEACGELGIPVVILDRPNPIGGEKLEGNLLEPEFASFVGLFPLLARHAMTIGEIAKMGVGFWNIQCELEVIPMRAWRRWMVFEDTGLPWVYPSPNMPTPEACFHFVGTVMLEGTNLSEGRGTTQSLSLIGHPKIEPYQFKKQVLKNAEFDFDGVFLRECVFQPTFQKHARTDCGGLQFHLKNFVDYNPWQIMLVIIREAKRYLGSEFAWKEPPYEYEYDKNPFDLIHGSDQMRKWVESLGSWDEMKKIQTEDCKKFAQERSPYLIYN